MTFKNYPSLNIVGLVWRTLVVGIVYPLVSMATAVIGVATGALSSASNGGDSANILLLMFVGGVLIALVMEVLSTKLPIPRGQRIGVLFLMLYMFAYLIGAPEVALFTTYTLSFQVFILIQQLIINLVIAILIGFLFQPPQVNADLMNKLKDYFSRRKKSEWLWRFALAAVLFFPIYFFFGFHTTITQSWA